MVTPQRVCGGGWPCLTCPQQSCLSSLPFSAVSPPPFHPLLHCVSQHFRSSLPRILSPASLAWCWYIQQWFWLWQMKVDCFESLWRNRVIVIYNSFMTLDDCRSWGRSFVAELVSLCENPILGRTPLSSTKVSDLPRRKDSLLTNDTEHPQARGTMRPVSSESKQVSRGHRAVPQIS